MKEEEIAREDAREEVFRICKETCKEAWQTYDKTHEKALQACKETCDAAYQTRKAALRAVCDTCHANVCDTICAGAWRADNQETRS